jgi:hypothetical protein
MENIDSNTLRDFLQNNNDGGIPPTINVFPDELVTAFMTVVYILTVVSVLFLVVYIVNTVRKWKVQSAILDMQKDIKVIKDSLTDGAPSRKQAPIDRDTSKIA